MNSDPTFLMQPRAVVHVAPGMSLTTTGCVFKADCPEMWEGIRLRAATSRWTSTGDNLSSAIRGVWSTGGGELDLSGTVFDGCWTGAFVEGGTAANIRRIQGCKFLGYVPLVAPFAGQRQPWAGVHVEGATGLVVGLQGAGITKFELLQHGVYCRDARVAVYNCNFVRMMPATAVPPVAPWSGYGVGMGAGVWSKAASAALGLTVGHATFTSTLQLAPYRCTFDRCRYGVYTQGTHSLRVRGNTFTQNAQGVRMGAATNSPVLLVEYNRHTDDGLAIWVGNTPNGNAITQNLTGRVAWNNISSSGAVAGLTHGIRCDLLTYTGFPIGFPFQINNNAINVRGNGIWLQTSTRIDVQANNVTLNAQSGDVIRGISLVSSGRNRVDQNLVQSNVVVDTNIVGIWVQTAGSNMVTCNTTTRLPRHVVFHGVCLNTDFLGNIMRSPGGNANLPAGESGLVLRISGFIGPQGGQNFHSDNKWIGIFSHSQTFCLGSQGVNSPFWSLPGAAYTPTSNLAFGGSPISFTNTSGNGPNCGTAILNSPKLTAVQTAAAIPTPVTARDSAIKYRADEWAYEAMLEDSALVANNPSIQGYYSDLQASNLGAATRANIELEVPDSLDALYESSLVNPVGKILTNHKEVQDARVLDDVVDSTELAELLVIAAKCPDLEGKGVHLARSVLAAEGILLWEDVGCTEAVPPPVKKQDSEAEGSLEGLEVSCWPNPTTGRIFVQFAGKVLPGRLEVVDGRGQTLYSRSLPATTEPIEIDGRGWAMGLVLVRVTLDDGHVRSWRVTMQR